MACYYGLATSQNRMMWVVFLVMVILGAIMLPLGLAKFSPCYKQYKNCQDQMNKSSFPDMYYGSMNSDGSCRVILNQCGSNWARVFIAGILCFLFAGIPLCFFTCCSRSPEELQAQQVPTAIALQPYPQTTLYPPPGMYPTPGGPYPPAGGPAEVVGIPLTAYPVAGGVPYPPAGPAAGPGWNGHQQQQQPPYEQQQQQQQQGGYYYYYPQAQQQPPPQAPPHWQPPQAPAAGAPANAFAATAASSTASPAAAAAPASSAQPAGQNTPPCLL